MNKHSSIQLTLNVRLDETATFNNFYAGDNQSLLFALRKIVKGVGDSFVYCWGGSGVGRSHLLQACCHELTEQGQTAAYVPLSRFRELSPEILDGLEALFLVCLDDVESVLGDEKWELALFNFYNRALDHHTGLVISADNPPQQLPCVLPDLASRLASGVVFHLLPLSDEQKLAALQLRAQLRGFVLSDKVGKFLLHHQPRDFLSLFMLLERLDHASLVEHKKLTIPFLKSVLSI